MLIQSIDVSSNSNCDVEKLHLSLKVLGFEI